MEEERGLEAIRQEIDAIDAALVELLNRRATLAKEVGLLKNRTDRPFFTPERERAILARLRSLNEGPLEARQLEAIFREVISAARAAEKPLGIAFWGPAGSYSHLAAQQVFGSSVEFKPRTSITEVFRAVEQRLCDYGVVPIENSVAGPVPETLDCFPLTRVKICAEALLGVHHHLGSLAPSLEAIRRVYAGPQPLAQCRLWLRENLPGAEWEEVVPTSRAAQLARRDPEGAAIVNPIGAALAELPIVASHIEDDARNRTRFVVIGFNEPARTGRDKTSLVFRLRNRPGELHRALGAFLEFGVNLSMIESRRPLRSGEDFLFYCDCVGHREDEPVRKAVEALRILTLETQVLGSYPAAPEEP